MRDFKKIEILHSHALLGRSKNIYICHQKEGRKQEMQKYGIQKHDLTQKRDEGNSRKIVKGVPGGSRVAMPLTAEEKDP